MDFNGGGGIVGLNPGGGFVPTNLVPQNQANLDYVNAVNQASLNPNTLYGPGGFGAATDYYSAQGAAYGRATGYYGDPYSSTPVSPSSGAGYADRDSLDPAGQAYYDAHVTRYGAPPYADNPGVQGPPAPPAPAPAPSAFDTGAPAYNTYGQPGTGSVGNPLYDSLDPGGKAYYDAHVLRYGAPPDANNPGLHPAGPAAPAAPPGPGASVQPGPFAPGGPTASDPTSGGGHPTDPGEGAALDPSTWNDAQKAYSDAHVLRYGTLPGANNTTMKSLADAPPMEEAPPNSPGGLATAGGFSPTTTIGGGGGGFSYPTDPGEGAALDQSTWNDAQKSYAGAHGLKYGTLPGANNATMRSLADPGAGPFQTATGDAGQSPGMAPGMGGFGPAGFRTDPQEGAAVDYGSLNPAQQAYFQAHYERYGTAPGANNTTLMGMGGSPDAASFNERFTGSPAPDTSGVAAINTAAGIDPNTGMQFGVPPSSPPPSAPGAGGALQFTGSPVNSDALNQIQPGAGSFTPASAQQQWLAEQRAPIATQFAADPEDQIQMAARILTEDANSPEGQQAVFEAIVNNQIATGKNMFDPSYYPKTGDPAAAYQKNLALMQNDPGLFGQMKEIMAKVLQGSNVSQGAFGWSQGGSPQAASDLSNANLTYSSPKTGADYNVFYRPTGASFGQGNIDKQNYWLSQMPP